MKDNLDHMLNKMDSDLVLYGISIVEVKKGKIVNVVSPLALPPTGFWSEHNAVFSSRPWLLKKKNRKLKSKPKVWRPKKKS